MILCPHHGCQPAMQVSRDVVGAEGQISPDVELIRVDYEYEGTPADCFYMSHAMASRLGFTRPTVLPLPDDYPPWVTEVLWAAVCVRCFAESRNP
jgi:hypothetical protein